MIGITTERTNVRNGIGGDVTGYIPVNTTITFARLGRWGILTKARSGYINLKSIKILFAIEPTIIDASSELGIFSHLEMEQTYPVEVNGETVFDYSTENFPVNVSKGHTIPVGNNWRTYLPKIQSLTAYNMVVTSNHLWINRDDWMAECICAGYGNLIEIRQTVINKAGKFHELKFLPYDFDTSLINAELFNWRTHPTKFGKETARKGTRIMNTGAGLDAYFPNIKRSLRAWVRAEHVELLPPLPDGFINYAVYGASIYGYDGLTYTPFRLARKPGELLHPYPGWTLNTPSVIPPKELL